MGSQNSQFRSLELQSAIIADGIARGVPFHDKDLQTLSVRTKSEGSSFHYVTLPSLGRAVDGGLVSGTFNCPVGFGLRKGTRLPIFLNAVLKTVFDESGVLLSGPNISSIFFLRQLLLINSKLVKEPSAAEEEKAVEGFRERQRALKSLRLPLDHPVLNIAQAILGKALRNLDLRSIIPGHGPGAVHEGCDRDEKWDFTYWPSQANKVYPFSEYGVQSLDHLKECSNRVVFLDKVATRIVLVPKDFRGPRLISVEMAAMQYLQQGQCRSMMEYIDSHRLLRLSIRLRDQTCNQVAASTAWQNDRATLDLSDASDTVSLPLVWFLLKRNRTLRKYLCRTRSSYANTSSGGQVRLCAFAPMGSATCFPVETLVFWAISMASVYLHRFGRTEVRTKDLFELATEVQVFGDDIVVPNNCLDTLCSTLISVGCKPNMSKTCSITPFRESCGTEWFQGVPVSITRNKGYTYDDRNKISNFPLLADLQRRLFVAGLSNSAELVSRWAMQIAPTAVVPFDKEEARVCEHNSLQLLLLYIATGGSAACFDHDDRRIVRSRLLGRALSGGDSCVYADRGFYPKSLRLRWNHQLQRVEFRVPVFYQKNRAGGLEGYTRLLARLLLDSSDRIAIRDRKIRTAWKPLPPGAWSFMTTKRYKRQ